MASVVRSRYRLPVLLTSLAVAATTLSFAAQQQAAALPHLTLTQVQARIASLNNQAERITEAYDGARGQLTALQRKEKVTAATLADDQHTLTRARSRVGAAALAIYRSGGMSPSLSLMATGNAQSYVNRAAALDLVSRVQADQVAAADAAQRAVSGAQAVYTAQVAQQRKTVAAIAAHRAAVQHLLAQEQQLLSRLKAADRRRLEQQQQAAQQQAVAQRSTYHANPHVPVSGQAGVAVKFAYAQLGKPYVYGGAGPNSYDCSGLTMAAWGAAGVGLAHNAAAQQASIPAVPLSAMQPGDLVFFGSPAYHVAIYIGGGRMIQAPHTGASVEITPVSYMSPSGAGRP